MWHTFYWKVGHCGRNIASVPLPFPLTYFHLADMSRIYHRFSQIDALRRGFRGFPAPTKNIVSSMPRNFVTIVTHGISAGEDKASPFAKARSLHRGVTGLFGI